MLEPLRSAVTSPLGLTGVSVPEIFATITTEPMKTATAPRTITSAMLRRMTGPFLPLGAGTGTPVPA